MTTSTGPARDAETDGAPRGVVRPLETLQAVAANAQGATLAELTAVLGIPKSSLLGLLRALVASGYLVHAKNRYTLGHEAFRLTSRIQRFRRFPEVLHPLLEELAVSARASVYLMVADRERCMARYIDGVESPEPVRVWLPPGDERPMNCSSGGMVLLAFQDDELRERCLAQDPMPALTSESMTSVPALRARIERTRLDGYALNRDESVFGASGIAAPIRDADGSVIAALSVAVPTHHFDGWYDRLLRHVLAAADRASATMGFSVTPPPSQPPSRSP